MSISDDFFVVKYLPDSEGVPSFMATTWTPELPTLNMSYSPPLLHDFFDKYELSAKTYQLDGDYLIKDHLVSEQFLDLCSDFNVSYVSRPVDVELYRNKTPDKKYYLFFLLDYFSILDENKSIFTVEKDVRTGNLLTPQDSNAEKVYYEKIDRFIVKRNFSRDLFFCKDIYEPVCSGEFKEKYESLGLKSICFIEINDSYKYDAWDGW